ncbi:MAG: GtrA family protein [Bacteroidota bacterium]|nr:GtrA family protein [Bacteroidota bacterium]
MYTGFIQKNKIINIFLKAQSVSMISSIVDFINTIILTELVGIWYALSSALGTLSGGVTCFFLSRNWVFHSKESNKLRQFKRFILVWSGSLILNFSGIYMLTEYLYLNYILSKIIIAILVGVFFNFVLQKQFVFRTLR